MFVLRIQLVKNTLHIVLIDLELIVQLPKDFIQKRRLLVTLLIPERAYCFIPVQSACVCVCVSLFYVIDTGSIGSRARHHVTGWG